MTPCSWNQNVSVMDYVMQIFIGLGHCSLSINDIEASAHSALTDLLEYLEKRPGQARLYDWRRLNFNVIADRIERNAYAKPRIKITININSAGNLSVCWYPTGWPVVGAGCDFKNFNGAETVGGGSRPDNELIYIHCMRFILGRNTERMNYLGSNILFAVRKAYENLIQQLKASFEITELNAFVFIQNMGGEVTEWKVVDALAEAEREKEAAKKQVVEDAKGEIRNIKNLYGVSLTAFVNALGTATKVTGKKPPTNNGINRSAAKILRETGGNLTTPDVARLRTNISTYMPQLLPENLRTPIVSAGMTADDE